MRRSSAAMVLAATAWLSAACATVTTSTPTPTEPPGTVPSVAVTTAPIPSSAPPSTPRHATPKPAASVLLDVAAHDLTENKRPDLEIWVKGHGSWHPDLEFGGDMKQLASFGVGDEGEFYVYPDGRDGLEIRVPFEMKPDMISGSIQARAHVEIYDRRVVVWGQAIEEIEATYKRYLAARGGAGLGAEATSSRESYAGH